MKTLLLLVLAGSAIRQSASVCQPSLSKQTRRIHSYVKCLMRSPKKLTRPTTTAMPPPWPHSTRRTLFW